MLFPSINVLQQQMKKNRGPTKLQLDKYYPTLRYHHQIQTFGGINLKINNLINNQSTNQSSKKQPILQVARQSPTLSLININKGQEFMRAQSKCSSLDILKKQGRVSLRPKVQYIIGQIQYIKNMIVLQLAKSQAGVFILIQQNQLKRIAELNKIGLLIQAPKQINKMKKSLLMNSNYPSRVQFKTSKNMSISKMMDFKVEGKYNQNEYLQNKQRKMEPILRKTKFRFAENEAQMNNGSFINKQELKSLKDVKSFHNISQNIQNQSKSIKSIKSNKSIKSIKSIKSNRSIASSSYKKKSNISIGSSTYIKYHNNIMLKQLQMKQSELNKKESNLLDQMNHLQILEDKYFHISQPSHKQILNNIEIFQQYKKLQSQFIEPKHLYLKKLKSKLQIDLPFKFQKIKQNQLEQLKIASKQQQLINNSDLLIRHIIYIVGQAYYGYLDGLGEMKESYDQIMQKMRRWAVNVHERRNIIEDSNKEILMGFGKINILMQELIKKSQSDWNESHFKNIAVVGEQIMELQRKLQTNYKVYISFI